MEQASTRLDMEQTGIGPVEVAFHVSWPHRGASFADARAEAMAVFDAAVSDANLKVLAGRVYEEPRVRLVYSGDRWEATVQATAVPA